MRLLLLALHPRLASTRLRITELVPHLESLGVQCDVDMYATGARARWAQARRRGDYDVVIVQKHLPSLFDFGLWRGKGAPLVFDFDDAVSYRQHPLRGSFASPTRRRRFARARRLAMAFACGNSFLASLVRDTGKPVAVIPTAVPIDVPQHVYEGDENPNPVRLGWIGGRGNLAELDRLRGPLAMLAREQPLEVVVIADAPWDAPGVPTCHVPWTLEEQAQVLASLDVGLMPLADNPWNRGKCAYKLLQYMAAGVCAIGSAVGMNVELIREGENGLLARNEQEWTPQLRRAITEVHLRRRLGAAGRDTVVHEYSFPAVARRWRQFLDELLGGE